jgi:hypothetical protein
MTRRSRHTLRGTATLDEKLHWDFSRTLAWPNEDEAFVLILSHYEDFTEERAHKEQAIRLERNGVTWIVRRDKRWYLNLDLMRQRHPRVTDFPWLRGVIEVTPKVTKKEDGDGLVFTFEITEEYMNEIAPKKIFLSHKGIDKERVRQYFAMLRELGFEPWLDDEAMAAGVPLERALLQGMKDSCAAIFFVTPNYKDEGYLATEIEYAIQEKRRKGDRFAIITLALGEAGDSKIPELLHRFVWKSPQSQFQALQEILRALPIKLPAPMWR